MSCVSDPLTLSGIGRFHLSTGFTFCDHVLEWKYPPVYLSTDFTPCDRVLRDVEVSKTPLVDRTGTSDTVLSADYYDCVLEWNP